MPAFALTDNLYAIKRILVNQGRMSVLENHPFIVTIDNDLFAFVRLLCSLKVDRMPQVFHSLQNVADSLIKPFAGSLWAIALLIAISPVIDCARCWNISCGKDICNLCRA